MHKQEKKFEPSLLFKFISPNPKNRLARLFLLIQAGLLVAAILLLPAVLRPQNHSISNERFLSAVSTSLAVINTNDSGTGSLRQALLDANAHSSPDTIRFAIPTSDPGFDAILGVWTIKPKSGLPTISDNGTVIDGFSQKDFAGDFNPEGTEIMIDGSAIQSVEQGFRITSSNNVISGLVISGFKDYGIWIWGNAAQNNWIWGNYIGTNATGTGALANEHGILLANQAGNNVIGGAAPLQGNLISGNNGRGCDIRSNNNRIIGNYIGVTRSGLNTLGNIDAGIFVGDGAQGTLIGGKTAGERNLISGNNEGVRIEGENTANTVILGNYIGTDINGTLGLGNSHDGILLCSGVKLNTIGGLLAEEANLIVANGRSGVWVAGEGTNENQITGNRIGIDVHGKSALANGFGLVISSGAKHNKVGPANIVSGNLHHGISVEGVGTDSNFVLGNWVGLDITGQDTVPNQKNVIQLTHGARYNFIGGQSTEDGNVAAGNGFSGLVVLGDSTGYNVFQNNYSGTDASGTTALGNRGHGALSLAGLFNKFSENLLSGNGDYGITLKGVTRDNAVMNNKIGIKADGITPLPNTFSGVLVEENASDCTIGPGNKIWFNPMFGIHLLDSTVNGITITQNSLKNNGNGGICLSHGANNQIEAPVITNNSPLAGTAAPNSLIEVFSDSSDQGSFYEGSTTADGSGIWTWSARTRGPKVTATATDRSGNTSEFSNSIVVGVEENVVGNPTDFLLAQNYPNPFNPTTTIQYELPAPNDVRIIIYDVLGRHIKTLVDSQHSIGHFQIAWDGTDEQNLPVAAGLYFCRMESGNFVKVIKLALVK